MNRSRMNQLLKIEKENENKDIKTKQKINIQSRGSSSAFAGASTSNAERSNHYFGRTSLSKQAAGRPNNSASYQQPTRSPVNAASTHQSEQVGVSTDSYVKSMGIFPHHKRLGPYMAPTPGPKPRLGQKQVKPTKQAVSPTSQQLKHQDERSSAESQEKSMASAYSASSTAEVENLAQSEKSDCEKIPLASPKRNWKGSESARLDYISPQSRLSTCSGSSAYINLDLDFCSLGSPSCDSEIFYMAPLIPLPSANNSSDSGASLERKFRHALDVSHSYMDDSDIMVVKNILKSDECRSILRKEDANPIVFKDILQTKLQHIMRNEKAVKSALVKLGTPLDIKADSSTEIIPISDLLLPLSDKSIDVKNIKQKSKIRRKIPQPSSEDDTPPQRKPKSVFQVENIDALSDDTSSARTSTECCEKRYLYAQRDEGNLKKEKLQRNKNLRGEYDEFLKSTLPYKQKTPLHKNERSSIREADLQAQTQMDLNVQDWTDDDFPKPKPKIKRRPQVNVTFKNVGTLEKEILILRALGDRLEATLNRCTSEPSLSDLERRQEISSSTSMTSLTKELQKVDPKIRAYPGRRFVGRSFGHRIFSDVIIYTQQQVECLVFAKQIRHEIGIANEFAIVTKTIDELKNDAKSSFYVPKSGQLLRMSYEILRQEPDLFMKILKPKAAGQHFNVLDHDPIFFNNFLKIPITTKTIEKPPPETTAKCDETKSTENITICEGGDSLVAAAQGIKKTRKQLKLRQKNSNENIIEPSKEVEDKKVLKKAEAEVEKEQTSQPPQPSQTSKNIRSESVSPGPLLHKRRSRIRQSVTPMPFDAFDEPKNTILKKVLIGVIQVSIFMGLIVALTLPDISC